MRRFVVSLALMVLLFPAVTMQIAAQEASKASIAVLEFSIEDVREGIPQEFETSLLRDKFITALVKTRKFDVVERAKLEKVIAEQEFSESGLVSSENAVNLGKMLAADYLIMGSISVFHVKTDHKKVPYVNRFRRIHEGRIIVDMRIVETEKGKIVAAEKGDILLKDEEMVDQPTYEPLPPEFLDKLIRKLVDRLTQDVIDGVYPVKIVKIEGDTAYLNRGEGGGLKKGERMQVFSVGDEIRDQDTGELLGRTESRVGILTVDEILPKMSKARIVERSAEIKTGYICRKIEKKAKKETTLKDAKKEEQKKPAVNW